MSDAANTTSSIGAVIGPDEELITLRQATECLPKVDRKKICAGTIWRWCRFGLRGVFLQNVRVGRWVCTSRPALLRFFTALAELDRRNPPDASQHRIWKRPITSRQRQRALAEADAILERAGI